MKRFSSLRVRLAGIVLLAVAPALALLIYMGRAGWMWVDFTVGLFALGAAWMGGELFILRQVKAIKSSARKLAAGDLSSRTDLKGNKTELGDLAHTLDGMAEALERQVMQREATEKALLNRALQQSAIAALGQCALQTLEMSTLFSQSVMLVAQTLEADFCVILELLPDGQGFRKRAGIGWNNDEQGWGGHGPGRRIPQAGFTLVSGEPGIVTEDVGEERRFPMRPRY